MRSWKRPTLGQLVQRIPSVGLARQSLDDQFADLALPHLEAVARFAMSLTREESDADDLTQETFLKAFRAWSQFTPGTECRAWLFTICRNSFLRTSNRQMRVEARDDAGLEALGAAAVHASAEQEGLEDMFIRSEMIAAVRKAVDELPEAFRETVVLVDLEEQSYGEAALVLGVPIGTVRSRLFRGRRLLQEILIQYARESGNSRPESAAAITGEAEC